MLTLTTIAKVNETGDSPISRQLPNQNPPAKQRLMLTATADFLYGSEKKSESSVENVLL